MPKYLRSSNNVKGFTLIEVMVVVALIGIIVTLVQFNFSGKRPEDTLKEASFRFVGIFETAADYGLLNNIELGLVVKDNSYQFLGYDGVNWAEIPEQAWLATQDLPEHVEITLKLDDLPIEDPLLFDSIEFEQEEEESFSLDADEDGLSLADKKKQKKKQQRPQVYLLSGGDITPFSLTFRFSEEMALIDDLSDLAYRVTGIYSIPLSVEGPVLDED